MFVALYEFKVKPGHEKTFKENWSIVTDAIYQHRHSHGSRLHRTEKENIYIAYALWPSGDIYHSDQGANQFTELEQQARELMVSACEDIKTLHLMEVIDDRIKSVDKV